MSLFETVNASLNETGCYYPTNAAEREVCEELCRHRFAVGSFCLVGGSCIVTPRRHLEMRIDEWGRDTTEEICGIPFWFDRPQDAPTERVHYRNDKNYSDGL
jgi:hypothetical protein